MVDEKGEILDNDANNEHPKEPWTSPTDGAEKLVVLDTNTQTIPKVSEQHIDVNTNDVNTEQVQEVQVGGGRTVERN